MKLYQSVHNFSLDIVVGALASSCFAARLFGASPGWAWWVTLAITIWVLYMGDHMLDAWKHRKKSQRALHQIIFKNRKILLWLMAVMSIIDVMLILNFLEGGILRYSLVLAVFVFLVYVMRHLFARNRVLFIPGEMFVLLIYLAGTWLGPFVTRSVELQNSDGIIALMSAGILLMNLALISLYDIHLDTRLGIASLAQLIGKKSTKVLIIMAGAGVYLMGILQFVVFGSGRYSQFALIPAGMATLLYVILFLPSSFRTKDQFRMAADAVLYMGFLSLLINT